MTKRPLNLLVNEDLVKKARNHGLNLSKFFENKLQEYFSFIDAVSISSKIETPRGRFELPRRRILTSFPGSTDRSIIITRTVLDEYLSLKEVEDLCNDWVKAIRRYLIDYLEYVGWKANKEKTLLYLKDIIKRYPTTYYRKRVYQIRKFLLYINYEWATKIKLPPEPEYQVKRVTLKDIENTLDKVTISKLSEKYIALIKLGATSGLRAEELYQLKPEDIDIDNRIVYVNHNPNNGQTTKTKMSRVSFFNEDTKQALIQYYQVHSSSNKYLFTKRESQRTFQNTPILVKDLRKYFSQEWDRRGGPTSIKKILMGHSLKGDVDLMHYNCQSEEDLKQIYDKVMGKGSGLGIG